MMYCCLFLRTHMGQATAAILLSIWTVNISPCDCRVRDIYWNINKHRLIILLFIHIESHDIIGFGQLISFLFVLIQQN